MKIKLEKLNAQGIILEGVEIEGGLTEYLKVASAVQTTSVSDIQRILNTLLETSTKARAEAKEWHKAVQEMALGE